jgi:hypothetical protein
MRRRVNRNIGVWALASNETKMSDGGRERASVGVKVYKSPEELERTAVRRSLHRLVRSFREYSWSLINHEYARLYNSAVREDWYVELVLFASICRLRINPFEADMIESVAVIAHIKQIDFAKAPFAQVLGVFSEFVASYVFRLAAR